jgi:predicted ATP-grasp superfamily ATP-dependent carboligase
VIKLLKTNDYDNLIKQSDKPIAFVLGKYITTGLGVCRCLGHKNIPTIWLDYSDKQIGFSSKYCVGKKGPNPRDNEKEYINLLLEIGENLNQKGILFPIGDIEVLSILKNKKALEKYFLYPCADLNITNNFLNKRLFYEMLEKLNIDYPKTYFPRNLSELKSIVAKLSYPCFIKPSYSASFVVDFKSKMFFIRNKNQLINQYKKVSLLKHDILIQEIIPGDATHIYGFNGYFDKKFKLNGSFTSRRIREWPKKAGCACFIEAINIPELSKIINTIIKKVNYFGVIDSDFIKDPRDGRFKLLDINPRFWMQISLLERCGINLPHITYLNTIGKSVEKVSYKNQYVKWLFMIDDIRSARMSISRGEISILKWLFSLRGKKEYGVFKWDDPLPMFSLFVNLISNSKVK